LKMTIPKHLMEAKLCNKETCEEIRTLKEENQRLKEQIRKYKDLGFEHLCKENQRLNNVLNELEKWLKEQRDYYFEYYYYSDFNAYGSKLDDVLNKLNELKESDK